MPPEQFAASILQYPSYLSSSVSPKTNPPNPPPIL